MSGRLYRTSAAVAHGVQPALLRCWRRLMIATAIDDTMASALRSCLVIAPHPDDETIGCGATIARKRANGTPVTVVIVADGRYAQSGSTRISPSRLAALRAAEAEEACARLGVDRRDVIQLGYEDTFVAAREVELEHTLVALLECCRPAEVLVVSDLDHHPDHRSVSRAAAAALRRCPLRPLVRDYAVWSWIDGPWLDQRARSAAGRASHLLRQPASALRRGRTTIVRSAGYVEAKRAALAAHATQTTRYTDEPAWAVMDDALLGTFPSDVELFLPHPADREARRC